MNKTNDQLTDWIRKGMQPIGPVSVRAMGEGQAVYLENVFFALVKDGRIWFYADEESDLAFDAAGSEWMEGSHQQQYFRSAPDAAYEDAKDLRKWAKQGMAAGRRTKFK
ncbi:TfoX/Sxy family protein [Chitinophaga solisilvae]|uniref:TfoX/Sxy family protein n=1 Tax=Chitinophaga solisilvae TaxID=1233460 RepID=A0A3S1CYU9_9BACT|nr:TfoX/Sxy family protein [Chitinophaga solisilvae]NSL90377.1 TfoX/Sxy family protein [Chitinophaga solisilvae]